MSAVDSLVSFMGRGGEVPLWGRSYSFWLWGRYLVTGGGGSRFLPNLLRSVVSLLAPRRRRVTFRLFGSKTGRMSRRLSRVCCRRRYPSCELVTRPVTSCLVPL